MPIPPIQSHGAEALGRSQQVRSEQRSYSPRSVGAASSVEAMAASSPHRAHCAAIPPHPAPRPSVVVGGATPPPAPSLPSHSSTRRVVRMTNIHLPSLEGRLERLRRVGKTSSSSPSPSPISASSSSRRRATRSGCVGRCAGVVGATGARRRRRRFRHRRRGGICRRGYNNGGVVIAATAASSSVRPSPQKDDDAGDRTGRGRRDRDIAVAASVLPRGPTRRARIAAARRDDGSLARRARDEIGAAPPGSPCRGRRWRSSRGHHRRRRRRETTTTASPSSGGDAAAILAAGAGAGVGIPGPSSGPGLSRRYDPADAIAGASSGWTGDRRRRGGGASRRDGRTDIRRRSRTTILRAAPAARPAAARDVGRGDRRRPPRECDRARGGSPPRESVADPPPGGPRSPVFSPPRISRPGGGDAFSPTMADLSSVAVRRRHPRSPLDQLLSEERLGRTTRRRSHSQSKEVALL
jgi:hypothetical protein